MKRTKQGEMKERREKVKEEEQDECRHLELYKLYYCVKSNFLQYLQYVSLFNYKI